MRRPTLHVGFVAILVLLAGSAHAAAPPVNGSRGGASLTNVDGRVFGVGVAQASISPDGRQVAYQKQTTAGWRIFVANIDGSGQHAITQGPHDDVEPCWRPDGKVIAFSSNRAGRFGIYTVHPDGSDVKLLDSSNQDERYPQWSPVQFELPYEKDPLAHPVSKLNKANFAPSDLRLLEALAKNESTWEDYKARFDTYTAARYYKLLFVSGAGEKRRIVTVRDDGRQRFVIDTGLPGAQINPAWTPDASGFAFVQRGAEGSQVYKADYPVTRDLNNDNGTIRFGIDTNDLQSSLAKVGPVTAHVPQIAWSGSGELLAVAVDQSVTLYPDKSLGMPPIVQASSTVAPNGFGWLADGRTALITTKSGGQDVLDAVTFSYPLVDIHGLSRHDELKAGDYRYLERNGFVAGGSPSPQMYQVYEETDYANLPIFVTTDSLLHLNHLTYDYLLRTVEAEHLAPAVVALVHHYLAASLTQASRATDPAIKKAALKNAAYFAVAAELALGKVHTGEVKPVSVDANDPLSGDRAEWMNRKLKTDKRLLAKWTAPLSADLAKLPADTKKLVTDELSDVAQHSGPSNSALFDDDPSNAPYDIDYTDFVPRGHYTKSEVLRRYFLVSHWLAAGPFRRSPNLTRRALLIVAASDPATVASWRKIEKTISDFVGGADDQNIDDYLKLSSSIYGAKPTASELANSGKLSAFVAAVDKLPAPRISPSALPSFRFLPAPYTADAAIMQNLVHDGIPPDVGTDNHPRPFALGLDVMGVLGSDRAHDILNSLAFMKPYDGDPTMQTAYENYDSQFDALRQRFADWTPEDWNRNLYTRILYAMQPLLTVPAGGSDDLYARSDAWTDKQLNAALGTWAELKHDTMPKQSTATELGGEGGIAEEPVIEEPVGYVEPQPEVYRRLIAVVDAERRVLQSDGYLTPAFAQRLDTFSALLSMVLRIEQKQQRGEPLNAREIEQLRFYGGYQEHLALITTEGGETGTLEGNDMAIVADVSSVYDKRIDKEFVLEEGVGRALPIYVAVPFHGHRLLAVGAVFTYYEFPNDAANRLTDQQWRELLDSPQAPSTPAWTSSYVSRIEKGTGNSD